MIPLVQLLVISLKLLFYIILVFGDPENLSFSALEFLIYKLKVPRIRYALFDIELAYETPKYIIFEV